MSRSQSEAHTQSCPSAPQECPLVPLGCTRSAISREELNQHMEEAQSQHLSTIVGRIQSLEKRLDLSESQAAAEESDELKKEPLSKKKGYSDGDGALILSRQHDSGAGVSYQSLPASRIKPDFVAQVQQVEMSSFKSDKNFQKMIESLLAEKMMKIKRELESNYMIELRSKDDEIAELKMAVTKMEKTMRAKNVEHEDRDFRLSLIENGNHDGTMIWKIPQFSQRKADAVNGKYTSIFSLPFYTGRYGYKMCLRLYIMGDGIGKGTHLSLFFVVMRGEFDNILQWPFTHKVTFKLINQSGGRDIVDTFQPDPMSSSFKKPTSDMNVASGCPRFVSHTELERGGFIVDDTIFVKCMINTSTIRHP